MTTTERILAEIPDGEILYLDLFIALAPMPLDEFLQGMNALVESGEIEIERPAGTARRVRRK